MYKSCEHITECGIGGISVTDMRNKKCLQNCSRKTEGVRRHADVGIDGRIILKYIIKEHIVECEMDSYH